MKTIERTCWCGKKFAARLADVKRGWARCCCKAHAAHAREKKLDRFGFQQGDSGTFSTRTKEIDRNNDLELYGDWEGGGWDSHKGYA